MGRTAKGKIRNGPMMDDKPEKRKDGSKQYIDTIPNIKDTRKKKKKVQM